MAGPAIGWARRELAAPGRWLDHATIAPDADPVRAVFGVLRAAANGERLGAAVPGPNPAVAALLEGGVAGIGGTDTFCATDRDQLDPVRCRARVCSTAAATAVGIRDLPLGGATDEPRPRLHRPAVPTSTRVLTDRDEHRPAVPTSARGRSDEIGPAPGLQYTAERWTSRYPS